MRRSIHKTSARARNEARELLQSIFAAELARPSSLIWLVSPWLRDVPILENRSGEFEALAPTLPRSEVRLGRILRELVNRGTRVVVASRPLPDGGEVADSLAREWPNRVVVRRMEELHVKGLVTDSCALTGSMNFTHNGIENLTELLEFEISRPAVEQLRTTFRQHYGVPSDES